MAQIFAAMINKLNFKGQQISKALFGILNSSKKRTDNGKKNMLRAIFCFSFVFWKIWEFKKMLLMFNYFVAYICMYLCFKKNINKLFYKYYKGAVPHPQMMIILEFCGFWQAQPLLLFAANLCTMRSKSFWNFMVILVSMTFPQAYVHIYNKYPFKNL